MIFKAQSLLGILFAVAIGVSLPSLAQAGKKVKSSSTSQSATVNDKTDEIQDSYLEKLKSFQDVIMSASEHAADTRARIAEGVAKRKVFTDSVGLVTDSDLVRARNNREYKELFIHDDYISSIESSYDAINSIRSRNEVAAKDLKLDALKYYKGKMPLYLSAKWKESDEKVAAYTKSFDEKN